MPAFTVPVGPPLRADAFLAQNVPGWSRKIAQRAIAAGAVNRQSQAPGASRRLRKGDFAQSGDILEIDDAWFAPQTLQPEPALELQIVHEDADIIVIDKPAGVPSVALQPTDTGTVANFLLSRTAVLAGIERAEFEAGLVHRLDTNTSGLLLAAKTPAAYRELRRQFASRKIEKEYLAVVHGEVSASGPITTPIGHDRKRHSRMRVVGSGGDGRPASTTFEPIKIHRRGPAYTLLKVRIVTGVMHQIRVHLASIGHPVVGDGLYGSSVELPGGRHLLHASRLGFSHPGTGKLLEVQSMLPRDFEEFAEAARQTSQ